MLYIVIEKFEQGKIAAVGERFRTRGRLMPENAGVEYVASWMASDGSCCYQIMRAPSRESLQPWIDAWSDLVDFEVTLVQTSADYWASRSAPGV